MDDAGDADTPHNTELKNCFMRHSLCVKAYGLCLFVYIMASVPAPVAVRNIF